MPLIKLIGLTLFVTAVFLLMIAAITKTTHLEFQSGSSETSSSGQPITVPADPTVPTVPMNDPPSQQISVPILWPLAIAAGAGLLVWFAVPDNSASRSKRGPASRKRRRR